ncbi:MAG: 2-oxoacid:ferredoxin oxidoreductase, gamma subunit [Candidatus Lokiarchaeum sp. GC14_75]|nr:MAG: 2-oxoacid:ferredoxin oxidoreductase, gamma subunit [Candidatus Lokiarchaeum sp. GC14_75]
MSDEKIIEISMHCRGGQTCITASQLLAEMAFEKNFNDTIAIPIIGAERRGAPVQAFTKISKKRTIKTYDSVVDPDYLLLFDTSLLKIPKIKATIKEGVTLIVNSSKPIKTDNLPRGIKIFIVDATGICIKNNFMHSSGPILNIPMLGAFGKITGYYDLDVMKKVIKKEFGENKVEKNMSVAKIAYETVREI